VKVFNSMIKDIHLTLQVKTFSSNSTHAMGPSTEQTHKSLDFPLLAIIGIAGREKRINLHTKGTKQSLTDYVR
jgi:hypothetical protein